MALRSPKCCVKVLAPFAALTRTLRWHRRVVAAVLAGLAALFALQALSPPPPVTLPVVVTTRAIPAGSTLGEGDVKVAQLPAGAAPADAPRELRQVVGRQALTALPAGAVVLREVTLDPTASLPKGQVLVPFRIADPAIAALVRVGDVVSVVAPDSEGRTKVVAARVRVAALPRPPSQSGPFGDASSTQSGVVVVQADSATGQELAAWASHPSLGITWG